LSANLDDLVPELATAARELVDAAGAAGLMPRVTSTLRSRSEQTRLYRRSQQGLQHYPVAPPGMSAHEYGWAFDLIVSPFESIYDVAYTWQQWGGAWNEADAVHFELPGASAEAKRLGEQAVVEQPSGFAHFLDRYILTVGPWWASVSGSSILKQGVAIEKKLGFDAAIDWFWRHVGTNPDKP